MLITYRLNIYGKDERFLCSVRLLQKPSFIPEEDDELGEYEFSDKHWDELGIAKPDSSEVSFTVEREWWG